MKFYRAFTEEKEYGLYESTGAVGRIYRRLREEAGKRPLTQKEMTQVGLALSNKKTARYVLLDRFFHVQRFFLNSPPVNSSKEPMLMLDFE